MREIIAWILFIWIIGAQWWPQTQGRIAHKVYNELKIGWDSVQP